MCNLLTSLYNSDWCVVPMKAYSYQVTFTTQCLLLFIYAHVYIVSVSASDSAGDHQ